MRTDRLAMAGLCLSAALPAFATPDSTPLDSITVTASRSAQPLQQAAPNVAVIDRTRLDRDIAGDIDQALAREPGVSVASDPARRGHAGPTIRGMDGNRILMLIDGQRLPDAYLGGGGNGAISGRDNVEFDSVRQIDIVKGPHSALYGSDAIGGVINYSTWSALDWLNDGQQTAGALRYSADGSNKGQAGSATMAVGDERLAGLLMLTHRRYGETRNMGNDDNAGNRRTTPNPQLSDAQNVLAKLQAGGRGRHQLELTLEDFRRDTDTDVISARSASLLRQHSTDSVNRQRSAVEYRYRPQQDFGGATVKLFQQRLRSSETLLDHGLNSRPPTGPSTRYGDYRFDQDILGVDAQLQWRAGERHRLSAGVELSDTNTSRRRNNLTLYSNGSSSNVYSGESFPSKNFPDSRSRRSAVYLQDAILLGNSGSILTPALRYDHYSLSPAIDAEYLRGLPAGSAVPGRFKDGALSPRLGLSMPLGDSVNGFATLASGFRAPPFDSALMAFRNSLYGYEILPNNDLKSEHSRGLELGLKQRSDTISNELTVYRNHYRDFIDRRVVGSSMAGGRPLTSYQYANIGKVVTQGVEVKTRWQANSHWQLAASLAYARGDDKSADTPLDSIEPLKTTLAASYDRGHWGGELLLSAARRQSRVSTPGLFRAPGYGVLDVGGWYRIGKHSTVRATLNNLGNKQYWQWADVRGKNSDSEPMARYTQPGRHLRASIETRF